MRTSSYRLVSPDILSFIPGVGMRMPREGRRWLVEALLSFTCNLCPRSSPTPSRRFWAPHLGDCQWVGSVWIIKLHLTEYNVSMGGQILRGLVWHWAISPVPGRPSEIVIVEGLSRMQMPVRIISLNQPSVMAYLCTVCGVFSPSHTQPVSQTVYCVGVEYQAPSGWPQCSNRALNLLLHKSFRMLFEG